MAIPLTRSLTPQTARKAIVPSGCIKNERLRRCTPWLRRITTTGVVRLAIISFLIATRLMADSIINVASEIVLLGMAQANSNGGSGWQGQQDASKTK